MIKNSTPELWVCWTLPHRLPEGENTFLSFLRPSEEDAIRSNLGGRFVSARQAASVEVRRAARDFYLDLVARLGTTRFSDGRTFRQELTPESGGVSSWWYHPVSFKDCESDPAFNWIIAVFTIRKIAEDCGAHKLVLIGAPAPVAKVLGNNFSVMETQTQRSFAGSLASVLRALSGRASFTVSLTKSWLAIRSLRLHSPETSEIVFSAFWHWSLYWDDEKNCFVDRYFGTLPQEIANRLNVSVAWFAWIDPTHANRAATIRELVRPLRHARSVVVLQAELGALDIVKAAFRFAPFLSYRKIGSTADFRRVFVHERFDFWHLFRERLLTGFLDASIVQCDLIQLATERASNRFRPKATFHFLEHFPQARAHYAAVRKSNPATLRFAVQHASYCHEKTFLFVDPHIEFRGSPDGCTVPHPDNVFTMGSFPQKLFAECGYPPEDIFVTGSTRYSGTALSGGGTQATNHQSATLRILLIAGLGLEFELELVDAVCSAVKDLPNIRLSLRSHPQGSLQKLPEFRAYADKFSLTSGSLEEDIAAADLILFTYSTAAEESFIYGKPVIRWIPIGFNGSALTEITNIPEFHAVGDLRKAIIQAQQNPQATIPSERLRKEVMQQLFHSDDGKAAQRIAAICEEKVSAHELSGV